MKFLLMTLALWSFSLKAQAADVLPPTVNSVDLNRYLGTWYEIASIPKFFQLGCTATTAEYSQKDNDTIEVHNSCRLFTFNGLNYSVKGEAKVVDRATNAKLSVKFFNLFDGDYWIFDLAEDYSYALVGSPDFDSLWILSRERKLDAAIVTDLKAKAETLGFDISRLKMSKQPE